MLVHDDAALIALSMLSSETPYRFAARETHQQSVTLSSCVETRCWFIWEVGNHPLEDSSSIHFNDLLARRVTSTGSQSGKSPFSNASSTIGMPWQPGIMPVDCPQMWHDGIAPPRCRASSTSVLAKCPACRGAITVISGCNARKVSQVSR